MEVRLGRAVINCFLINRNVYFDVGFMLHGFILRWMTETCLLLDAVVKLVVKLQKIAQVILGILNLSLLSTIL